MGGSRRAALTGMEGGQALEVDLQEVPRQDSGRSTHALDHGKYSTESSKLPPTGGHAAAQALSAYLPLGICWDECLKRAPLILLLASPIAGAVVFEESGVQGEKHWGDPVCQMNRVK
jgi:hypothetical protein